MRMLNGSCMWWETVKDDESKYWTTCAGSPEILNESDSELAEMCWRERVPHWHQGRAVWLLA